MPSPRSRFAPAAHRPALDGLRSFAVLSVMLYHLPVSWARGGFLGVDVFFVLSGYLITTLLVNEEQKWGHMDLFGFYVRRARRLLPALFLVVAFITLVGPHVLTDAARSSLRGDGLATVLYVANWRFILQGQSYFSQFGDPSPYRHMWSLAIEEQFYLVLPLLLVLLIAVLGRRRKRLAVALGGLAILSAIWCAMLFDPLSDPSRPYYGTDTRAQELLVGSTLSLLLPLVRRRLRDRPAIGYAGGLALLGILASFVLVSDTSNALYRGGFLAFCVVVAVLIASVELAPGGPVGRLVSLPPLVWIGSISYGLYLWHWPVYVFLSPDRTGLPGIVLFALRMAATFGAAAASYYLLERPIREGRMRRSLGSTRSALIGLAAPLAVIIAVVATTTGIPYVPPAKAGSQLDVGNGSAGKSARILVVGDSVGFALGYAFPQSRFPDVGVLGKIKIGCGTAEQWLVVNGVRQAGSNPDCNDLFQTWQQGVQSQKPQVVLWMLGPWDVFDHYVDGKVLKEQSPAYASYFTGRLEQGLKALGPDAKVVIPNVPCYKQPSFVVEGQDIAPNRNDPGRAAALNKILAGFAAKHPDRVRILDYASWICPSGKYTDTMNGQKVRQDGVHLTNTGVEYFWTWAMPQLRPWLRSPAG
ncbi:acyltransferase [Calidifontibacter sp. DB0510]|uniref:Acyltransferase n=1 Tax=Metallococcus carri TaxID=1656884 RepID=A0A967AZ27_9MICO|nr:acyltransferase family protein [Metallococcus carri]NHN55724.1 acyltransferase [Metallococcus carri]NOP38587.1 acyltransferase [Calidifontibacter sp. DB2511S]